MALHRGDQGEEEPRVGEVMTDSKAVVSILTEQGKLKVLRLLTTVLGYVANSKPNGRSGLVLNTETGEIRGAKNIVIDEVRAVAALFGWTVRDPEPEKAPKKRRKS